MSEAPLISSDEIRVLNAARDVLAQVAERSFRRSYETVEAHFALGRMAETSERASGLIFETLNVMNSYRLQSIDNDQLFNQKEGTPDA